MKISFKPLENTFLAFLFLFTFCAVLFPFESTHFWDESVYLQHAEIFSDGRTNYSELDSRPPFLPFIISLGYVFWHNMFMAQIVVALINTLGVMALYFLAKRIAGWQAGVICSIAISTSPFFMEYSHYILTDFPSFSILTGSILFLYKSIDIAEKRSTYLFMSGLLFGLSILTRYTSLFFVLFFAAVFYAHKEKFMGGAVPNSMHGRITGTHFKTLFLSNLRYGKEIILASEFVKGLLVPLLPYFIFAQINYGFFLFPFIKAQLIIASSTPEPFYYYGGHFLNIFGAPATIGLFLGMLFLLAALIKYAKEGEKISSSNKELFLLLLFLVVFLIYFSIMSHKEERYLIPIFFAAYVLSGYGLISFANIFSKNKHARMLCFLIMALLIFVNAYPALSEHFKQPLVNNMKTETALVSEYLKAEAENNTRIYATLNYPVIAYYSGMEVRGILPKKEKLICNNASFANYRIERRGYLVLFPKSNTFEQTFVNYTSMETCGLLAKIADIDGALIYKFK